MLRVVYICEESYFQLPNLHGPKALSLYSICSVRFSLSVKSDFATPWTAAHHGEYQADERAGVARLSWRVSGR